MKRRSMRVEAAHQGMTLARFLEGQLGTGAAQALEWVKAGAVYVDGRRALVPALPLRSGQTVMAVLEESGRGGLEVAEAPAPLQVLFEDSAVLAVAKPAGVLAQPSPGRQGSSLLDQVSAYLGRPAGLVHRLDRDTSGVTVFGKSAAATSALAAQFREGTARKRYLAATGPGLPEEGEVDLPLSKDPSRPGRFRASDKANGVPAFTSYLRLASGPDHCLVALFPRTGRTHQLRAHLAALGAPILGDSLYGGASEASGLSASRCLLHAQALALRHPTTGAPWRAEAAVPADLLAFFALAQISSPSGPWAEVP